MDLHLQALDLHSHVHGLWAPPFREPGGQARQVIYPINVTRVDQRHHVAARSYHCRLLKLAAR